MLLHRWHDFYTSLQTQQLNLSLKGRYKYYYLIFNFLQCLVRTIKGAKPPNWKLSWNLDVEKVTKSHKKRVILFKMRVLIEQVCQFLLKIWVVVSFRAFSLFNNSVSVIQRVIVFHYTAKLNSKNIKKGVKHPCYTIKGNNNNGFTTLTLF